MRNINAARMSSGLAIRIGLRALAALAALVAVVSIASAVDAAELYMFRRDGCVWCAKWDREIGPIYPKTEFEKRAPLRLINLDHDREPAIVHAPIHYTPTFVLVEGGKELGRIEGYPGDLFFWPRLEGLLAHLPAPAPNADLPKPDLPKDAAVPGATPVTAGGAR